MTLERDWRILGGTRMAPQEAGNRGQGPPRKHKGGRKEGGRKGGGEQGNSANRRNVKKDPSSQSGGKDWVHLHPSMAESHTYRIG